MIYADKEINKLQIENNFITTKYKTLNKQLQLKINENINLTNKIEHIQQDYGKYK